jgi:hypothetical protein
MLRPICKIKITKKDGKSYIFDYCNSIEINSSFDTFTDTAKLTLPRKIKFFGKDLFTTANAIFSRGDKIKIELGYLPNPLKTAFDGYITYVGASLPVEIECEDKMFILKQTAIEKYSKVSVTLSDLLKAVLPSDIKYKCLDVTLGSFRLQHITVSKLLDILKDDYGFYSYFVDGVLNVGFPSDATDTKIGIFEFEKTIIDSDALRYQIKEQMFIKVVAISMNKDNTKTEVTVGDSDGGVRTFHTYNSSKAALTEFANLKLDTIKYTGYTGSFTTLGEPFMRHGDAAKLVSTKLPERNGKYQISAIKRTFGMGGYKQEIELNTIL